jgi:hypothetical protein
MWYVPLTTAVPGQSAEELASLVKLPLSSNCIVEFS